MEYKIGALIAVSVAALGYCVGFDREHSFAATILIVVASYYILFAILGGSSSALQLEILIATGFLLLSVIGYRKSVWLLPTGIAGHGVFDLFHHHIVDNAGLPVWWPGFCMTFDVVFGLWLAALLLKRSSPPALAKIN